MNEIIQSSVYKTQKGTPVTDSVKVAQVFGKMHKNIMKSIRNIMGSAQNLANEHWFAETTYTDAQGKRQPMFLMNRDGFSNGCATTNICAALERHETSQHKKPLTLACLN